MCGFLYLYLSLFYSFLIYIINAKLILICYLCFEILLKSTGTGTNLSTSNLSTLLIKLLKLVDKFFNLSISNLSPLDFKLAQSTFSADHDVSTPVAFFKSAFVA